MSTAALGLDSPVGQWVRQHPETSREFDKHGIDFCCGGKISLRAACEKKGIDGEAILGALRELVSMDRSTPDKFAELPLGEMCDRIVTTHHAYLKAELPRLEQMLHKVVRVHGEHHPWLSSLQSTFASLQAELIPHMFKEEHVLFPAIKQIASEERVPTFPFGSIENPIRMMEQEHDAAGALLAEIRRLTSDYTPPADACNTFRALFAGLRELELDLHQHIHRENNVLFVRAEELVHPH